MLPDKPARNSIRLRAILFLLALLWLSDAAFDAISATSAADDCYPRTVVSVDTSGFWTATVTCAKEAAPVKDGEILPEPPKA